MATVRSASQNSSTTGTAISVSKPSGASAGDFVVCIVHANNQTTISDNNGSAAFTEAPNFSDYKPNTSNGHTMSVFSRTLDGTEGSTFDFTSGASGRWGIVVICFNGAHQFDVAPNTSNADNADGNDSGTINVPSISVSASTIHVAFCGWDTPSIGTITTPSGYTLAANANGGGEPTHVSYKAFASSASTGLVPCVNSEYGARIVCSFSVVASSSGYSISISSGSFSLTGISIALAVSRLISIVKGTFTVSGISVGAAISRYLSLVKGTFSVSGISSAFSIARYIAASLATYSVTGISTTLSKTFSIASSVGSFVLTGVSSIFSQSKYIAATVGSFVLSGISSALSTSRYLLAQYGQYTVSGVSASLNFGYYVSIQVGTFILSGISAVISAARNISVSVGSFALSGIDAILTKSGSYSIIAGLGEFTVAGIQAGISASRRITISVGSFVVTGVSSIFNVSRGIVASSGSFVLTGVSNVFTAARYIFMTYGAFVVTGISASIQTLTAMIASAGSFVLSGISIAFEFTISGVIKNAIGIVKEFVSVERIRENAIIGRILDGVIDIFNDPSREYDEVSIMYDDANTCYNNYVSSEKPTFSIGRSESPVSVEDLKDKPRIQKL